MKQHFIFVSFFLSLIGFFIFHSQYYSGDMVVHAQYIKQIANPKLYNEDYTNIFWISQKSASIYYPFMSFMATVLPFDLYTDFRFLYFLYLNFLFAGLLFVASALSGSLWVGIVWVLLLMAKVHIGGSAIVTIETDFVPRAISLGFITWSFFFILKKKYKFSFVLMVVATLVHVLTGLYALSLYALYIFLVLIRKRNFFYASILVGLGIASVIWLNVHNSLSPAWLEVLRFRNHYAFYDLWSWVDWRNLLIVLIPGFVGFYFLPQKWQKAKDLFAFLLIGILLLSIVHFVFVVVYPQWSVIILQLGRSWLFLVYVSLLLGAGVFIELIPQQGLKKLGILLFAVCIIAFNLSKPEQKSQSWIEVQKWAREHTDTSCVFLTPFFVAGFRVNSERVIVGDMKDGTLSFYSEPFALEWKRRYDTFSAWETLPLNTLRDLQQDYIFNYLVVTKPKRYELPLIFENEMYSIYHIASSPLCKN